MRAWDCCGAHELVIVVKVRSATDPQQPTLITPPADACRTTLAKLMYQRASGGSTGCLSEKPSLRINIHSVANRSGFT